MNIYTHIKKMNSQNMDKPVLSISLDSGLCRSYTYSSMFSEADTVSAKLLKTGLVPGDRIAIIAENCPEWAIAYLAVLKITCTAVLIDAMLPPDDIIELLNKSDVSLILTSPKTLCKMNANQLGKIPVLNILDINKPYENYSSNISADKQPTKDCDESIANIIYSSGTTRLAAGIMHTHESMICSTQMCLNQIDIHEDERFLAILPYSHIYGIVTTLIGPLLAGAQVRFIESLTSEAILSVFAEYKPSIFPAVPKMLSLFSTQIMRKIESNKKTKLLFNMFFPICYFMRKKFGLNLGKKLFKSVHDGFGGALDIICSAGAPLDKATADFYYGCGLLVLITYGATETNIPTIGNLRHNLSTDTCGKAYPDVDIKISDSNEILIKSPYMMKGYFRDELATEKAFKDDWFMTGDLGFVDEKGNYHITGRVKDNIVLATGKKVIPDDIEAQYSGIFGVKEFIVCGVPASMGECDEVHAFIVLDENGVCENVAKAVHDIGASLTSSMKIMQIHFVDSIPRTSLQKPKRYLLKKSVISDVDEQLAASNADIVNVEDVVIGIVSKVAKTDKSMITGLSRPFSQLGIDSLSSIDLALQIEEMFKVRIDEMLTKNMTVSDIVCIIENCQTENLQSTRVEKASSSLFPLDKRLGDYRLFRHICGWARMLYKITVKGEKMLPLDSGYIICANHLSNFDYLWLSINFEKERFSKFCCMAKKELFKNSRFSKRLSRICGMIPVDRENANAGLMQCCKTMLNKKWGLLIHPEGTRSSDGSLGLLKNGAALLAIESNVPIVPAYINGAFEIYPKGKKLPKLFNFSKMRKYHVEVAYGEPIYPKNLSVEQLTKLVEESMKSLCIMHSTARA